VSAAVPLVVGVLLAGGVGVLGRVAGLDRDRALYPTATIVIASYYALFAVMGGTPRALVLESLVAGAFLVAAVAGFRRSLWITAIAVSLHGVFDFGHGALISNAGVPAWWPWFCGAYDVTAGGVLAWLLASGRVRARADGAG
jgi:hypothetical protein